MLSRKIDLPLLLGRVISRRGQSIIEYAIVIAIATAACSGMAIYLRRAVQGATKLVDDEYSETGEGWSRAQGYAQGTSGYQPGEIGVILPPAPNTSGGAGR